MDIKFYSLEEVADLFGVNYQLIYKLVKSGELPSVRIGKMFRVSAPQLKEYMDRQSQGTPASGSRSVLGRATIFFSALGAASTAAPRRPYLSMSFTNSSRTKRLYSACWL